jgi:uncharacterized protein DUF6350
VDPEDEAARRSVVPEAARRSLWLAAAWTGVGAAVVCATVGIVAVAICWLPAAGASADPTSAIHAGLLTFLAAVHGGITVDGTSAAFLPLGLMIIVGMTAWRAGSGLADAANALGEDDALRLALAGAAQTASFTLACVIAVPFARLGTSSAPLAGVAAASFLLFAVTGGIAFTRSSALAGALAERVGPAAPAVLRAAAGAVLVYLGAGAVLVAGSLAVHASRLEALSGQLGGGWSSVPVLLLDLLAAPNAAIAGAAYLAGPGFAVGTATTASVATTSHGVLPAFPLLAAMPTGHGANSLVWTLVLVTPLVAGLVLARLASRAATWPARFSHACGAAGTAGATMVLLAWQGGGAIGDGTLGSVGASPWRTGLFVMVEVGVVAAAALGIAFAAERLRERGVGSASVSRPAQPRLVMTAGDAADKPDRARKLAG